MQADQSRLNVGQGMYDVIRPTWSIVAMLIALAALLSWTLLYLLARGWKALTPTLATCPACGLRSGKPERDCIRCREEAEKRAQQSHISQRAAHTN
jgi:hypothetical protein